MSTGPLENNVVFAKDYKVLRPLDEGGMGAVYVVEQLSTGEQRALKVMQPHLVTDPRTRERFLQETRVRALIKSEHAVKVIAAGVDEATSTPWMVMELLDGETLDAMVTRQGRLVPADVCTVFEHLGHALSAAHAAGVVHRDIKPENIFVATSQRADVPFTVKLLDFGIAKVVQGSVAGATTGNLIGSPLWMAPEQCNAGRIRAATDVWALGLLAFWAFTGEYYWVSAHKEDMTIEQLLTELLISPIAPASERAATYGLTNVFPPGFDEWFARSLLRDPAARFNDAAEAVNALLALLSDGAARVMFPSLTTPTPRLSAISGVPVVAARGTPLGAVGAPARGADDFERAATVPLRGSWTQADPDSRYVKLVGLVAAVLVAAAAISVLADKRPRAPAPHVALSAVAPPAVVDAGALALAVPLDAAPVELADAAVEARVAAHPVFAGHPAFAGRNAPRAPGHTFQRHLDWDSNCSGRQRRAWAVSPTFASHSESETAARGASCVDIVGGIGWCCP